MPTHLAIGERLLARAVRLGGHRTKRATVNEALEEYIKRRQRLAAIEAFATVEFDPRHDDKRARKTR